jgi:hypothetical protein
MDIDMIHLPCSILSLDVQDVMGIHILNIGGNLKKMRIDKNGKHIGEPAEQVKPLNVTAYKSDHAHDHDEEHQPDFEMVKKQLADGEGCKIRGTVTVNKVD